MTSSVKKYIGWDIGVKNLAYCVLSLQEKKIEIVSWNIINLADEESAQIFCSKCDKKAVYNTPLRGKNRVYFCGKHREEDSIKVSKKVVKKDIKTYGLRLKKVLDENKALFTENVSRVVIENQPSLKNPFMKSIQMLLYSWFLFNQIDVSLLPASSNLKVFKGEISEQFAIKETANPYTRKKRLAVAHCKMLLSPTELHMIDQNKKKLDDLCDAYLLARYSLLN